MNTNAKNTQHHAEKPRVLIKKCHICGHLNEGAEEMQRCSHCNKSFLPLNYFSKVHSDLSDNPRHLFCHCNELAEEDIIRGLYVLW